LQYQDAPEDRLNLERDSPIHAPMPEMGVVECAWWRWPDRGARSWVFIPVAGRHRLRIKRRRVSPPLPEKDE
jgi:hypothetical protein